MLILGNFLRNYFFVIWYNLIHKSNNLSEKDILHIIVLDYCKEALHFEYEDGSGEWYDASKVKLINSKIYTNIFYIYHYNPVDNDPIWKTKDCSNFKEKLSKSAASIGSSPPAPFSILSFLALPVIPELRLTDLGLVDVIAFKLIKQQVS